MSCVSCTSEDDVLICVYNSAVLPPHVTNCQSFTAPAGARLSVCLSTTARYYLHMSPTVNHSQLQQVLVCLLDCFMQ